MGVVLRGLFSPTLPRFIHPKGSILVLLSIFKGGGVVKHNEKKEDSIAFDTPDEANRWLARLHSAKEIETNLFEG